MSDYDEMLDRDLPLQFDSDGDPTPKAKSILQWLDDRKRRGAVGSFYRGFGPEGLHTLQIPPLTQTKAIRFKNGVPTEVDLPGVEQDAELEAFRQQIIEGTRRIDTLVLSVPALTLTYAARLLRRNYALTDEDLDVLLGGQKLWVEGIIRYVLGGDVVVKAQASGDPDVVRDALTAVAWYRQEQDRQAAVPVASEATPSVAVIRKGRVMDRLAFWK